MKTTSAQSSMARTSLLKAVTRLGNHTSQARSQRLASLSSRHRDRQSVLGRALGQAAHPIEPRAGATARGQPTKKNARWL